MSGTTLVFVRVFGAMCVVGLSCATALAQASPSGKEDEQGIVLRIESREAVIDVVARDRHNLPITDLAAKEFEVYEIPRHGSKISRRILDLRTIDSERRDQEDSAGGFHVSSGAVCALDATRSPYRHLRSLAIIPSW